MASDRFAQIELAYHDARARHGEDRSRFLDGVCGEDTLMRQQIETLLRHDSTSHSVLDRPAIDSAIELTPPIVIRRASRANREELWPRKDTKGTNDKSTGRCEWESAFVFFVPFCG